jgi:ABC-type nitrate/sulfonate/bicarbonate transport system permease component
VALLALIIVAWEAFVRLNHIPVGLVPAPSRVVTALVEERALFASNLGVTMVEILAGFGLGLALGVLAGVGLTYSGAFARAAYPLILASQAVPIFAFAPLLIIWLGFGLEPKIVMVVLGVFFPVTVNVTAGLRSPDQGMVDLLRAYSASEWQIFRMVRWPSALPYLVPAAQIGMTYAVIGAVISEWIGAQEGIGKVMVAANSVARTDQLFGAMLLITVVALALFGLVRAAGRALTPWERPT